MDYKSSESNKALSFALSIFFHAAFVCSAALLPLYFSSQETQKVNEIDVAVVGEGIAPETGTAATIPEVPAPAAEEAPVVIAPKAEVTVTKTIVKPKPVEAIKEAPKKKPAQRIAPKRVMMAEKTDDDSQPIIEVAPDYADNQVNDIDDSHAAKIVPEDVAHSDDVKETDLNSEKEVASEMAALAATPAAATSAPATEDKPQNFLGLKQAAGNHPPSYPREMRLQKLEGKGQLSYYVAKDGTVKDIKVNKSSGVAALDQAALSAFSKYKFEAGQEGYTVHNYEFTLKGPAESDSPKLRTTYQENK